MKIEQKPFYVLATHDDSRMYIMMGLVYDTDDPFALTITFDQRVTWVIARDLIATGLVSRKPVGQGDVQAWRTDEHFVMTFVGEDPDHGGESYVMKIAVDYTILLRYMRKVYNAVPEGFELNFVNVDDEIGMLLAF